MLFGCVLTANAILLAPESGTQGCCLTIVEELIADTNMYNGLVATMS